jgi:acyl-CoA thioesterase-2
VLGQSLSAASQTVEDARHVHSLHGYFLRPGDASMPVVYSVDRVRDGGSFSTRRVTAIQKGQPIFTCSVVPVRRRRLRAPGADARRGRPGNLPSEVELASAMADQLPERIRDKVLCAKPIEIRPVTERDPFNPKPGDPVKYAWFRADGNLPDTPALHKYLLAYASDFGLLTTALLPHGKSVWQKDMQIASLDHSLWFHRNLRADEWLLYATDSPWAGNARGFCRGSIFNRAGQLVASSPRKA